MSLKKDEDCFGSVSKTILKLEEMGKFNIAKYSAQAGKWTMKNLIYSMARELNDKP